MTSPGFLSRAANRTFYYGFGSIIGKIIGFIMLPIYTNYLTPTDYGVAGFLVFFVSLAQITLGGKLEHAISKFYYDDHISDSLGTILASASLLTFAFSIVPLTLSLYFSESISILLFDQTEYTAAVAIVSLNILFGTTEIYGLQYIRISDLPRTFLFLHILKLSVQLTINIVLIVYLNMGVLGIIVSSASASILMTVVTGIIVFLKENSIRLNTRLIPKLVSYSAPLWLSGLLGLYSGSIHQVFIKYFASLADLGLYNLAGTFGGLVGTLAWIPFFSFWSVERFRIHQKGNAESLFRKVFYWTAGISFFMSFGISVFAGPIIEIMASPDFHPAIKAVAPLSIFVTVMYLGWYLNFAFLVTDNNREIAINSIIYMSIITIIFFVTIPKWGFVGAAYGIMVANICNLHIVEWRSRRFYNIGVSIVAIDLMIVVTLIAIFAFNRIDLLFQRPLTIALVNAGLIVSSLVIAFIFLRIKQPDLIRKARTTLFQKSVP